MNVSEVELDVEVEMEPRVLDDWVERRRDVDSEVEVEVLRERGSLLTDFRLFEPLVMVLEELEELEEPELRCGDLIVPHARCRLWSLAVGDERGEVVVWYPPGRGVSSSSSMSSKLLSSLIADNVT